MTCLSKYNALVLYMWYRGQYFIEKGYGKLGQLRQKLLNFEKDQLGLVRNNLPLIGTAPLRDVFQIFRCKVVALCNFIATLQCQ